MTNKILAVVLCAMCSACAGVVSPTVAMNQDFILAPDQSARIESTAVDIRFVGVEGDSRCPADAMCIQGGDAIVKIQAIDRRAGTQPYDLHTGSLLPVTHDGLTIRLVQLAPYPFSSRTIPPSEYRATLVVSR